MKKRILAFVCVVALLIPMLLSCDNPNESESTTPEQVEETTTASEDLSDIPVRDVSDYPTTPFISLRKKKHTWNLKV